MVTTVLRLTRLRNTNRLHPLPGPGDSATPTSFGSTSMSTGTPGSAPLSVPMDAVVPSMVMVPFFSSFPDHVTTPAAGAAGRTTGGGAFGRT